MDNSFEQLKHQLHHEVHHAVDEALASPSPVLLNRTIGESMRHIGVMLEMQSTAYIPVRPEEILVKPHPVSAASSEAVLLIGRTVHTKNGFLVLADVTSKADGSRDIELFAYQPDVFNLTQTKFLKLPEPIGKELLRQFNELVTADGTALFQAVIANDYFKGTQTTDDPLFNSDMSPSLPAAEEPVVQPAAIPSGLPAASHDGLL